MKKVLYILLIACYQILNAQSSSELLWMQQPSLSPDGQWIAFEYKGNLLKVSSLGGQATPLTQDQSYNGYPVWSHDGLTIAFASNRNGNFDVFTIPSSGGKATRLTFDSSKDIPYEFSKDNTQIYFGTDRHDTAKSARFPADNIWLKLYSVPAKGGRNLLINTAGTEYVHFNTDGTKFIFQDRKGGEDSWRKHHTSSVTRDIWMYDMNYDTYLKLSDFDGEDREPVWGEGNSFYYLSEQNGTQNLFKSSIDARKKIVQLTFFTQNPVRNLSRSQNNLLAFTQNGELYTFKEGTLPKKIKVTYKNEPVISQVERIPINSADQIAVSPNSKEIAIVVHGEIYVVATDGSSTKQITHTPYQESMPYFSNDGKSLIYSAETDGSWDIYKAVIESANDSLFYNASSIKLIPIITTPMDEFQGIPSPDGKNIAYLEERNILKVYNFKDNTTFTLLPKGNLSSYQDGDQAFIWSPDSKAIIIPSAQGHAGADNVLLVQPDPDSLPIKLTQSGYNTRYPRWGMNGNMFYYRSDKNGMTSLSQSESETDVYGVFLDQALFDRYIRSKSEDEYQEKKSGFIQSNPILIKPSASFINIKKDTFDINQLSSQTIRLTTNSSDLSDAILSDDGESLYYIVKYQSAYDLWLTHPRTHENKLLAQLNASHATMQLSNDGRFIFILADGKIIKFDIYKATTTAVAIDSFLEVDLQAERASIFEHIYATMPKKYFDPKLQGIDWNYYHEQYSRFLPHINNNFDFQIFLSEFLGELNSSHTGAKYKPTPGNGDQTFALGLLYNLREATKGLVVEDIIKGGPFDSAFTKIKKGFVIDKIDNVDITEDIDWAILLNNKKGQHIQVSFYHPGTANRYNEAILPITAKEETALLYDRWVRLLEHHTDSISGGTIGYIHIASMNDDNYRALIDKVNGKYQYKKALLIDTRYNPGGNLQNKLIHLFSNKIHLVAKLQGHSMVQDALPDGSFKPTSVLISEGNYSDGFNFPYLYQRLKIGKLVGTPVAGTGTGVFWEKQIDDSITVGFPQMGLSWIGEQTLLENHPIYPDIKVYNNYATVLAGKDLQLQIAIKELLKKIDMHSVTKNYKSHKRHKQ